MAVILEENNAQKVNQIVHYHLPGLFEFFDFYKVFLKLYREYSEYFYDWCDIASIYGSPEGALWGGGRTGSGNADPFDVQALLTEYQISARLTFSNSLIREEHLSDHHCNRLCKIFNDNNLERSSMLSNKQSLISSNSSNLFFQNTSLGLGVRNGVIIHSDILLNFLKKEYKNLYFVSSTTKVLTSFDDFYNELQREEFLYVVPDFRLNKQFDKLVKLPQVLKDKVEFLCNECCFEGCKDRKTCYENVSRKNLGEDCIDHKCRAPNSKLGYKFSRAMESPLFMGIKDIKEKYLPLGFSNFKIEGRELGSAILLEFILYYMTKPECHLKVREEIYLDSNLDLF